MAKKEEAASGGAMKAARHAGRYVAVFTR